MTKTYYGPESHVMFGYELVAYGTQAATLDIDFGKVISCTIDETDNPLRDVGVGEGRDETSEVLGVFDCTGTIVYQLRHARSFPLAWGDVTTTGSSDPYSHAIAKASGSANLSVGADLLPSFSLEIAKTTGATDNVKRITGCYCRSLRIQGAIGGPITCTLNFVGQKPVIGTSAGTYTASTDDVFVVSQAIYVWDGDTVAAENFDFTINNNVTARRTYGDRLIAEPMPGGRKHDYNITMSAENSAYFTGMQADYYGQAVASGPVNTTGATKALKTATLTITKTAVTRQIILTTTNSAIDSWNEPIEGEGRVIANLKGHSLSSTVTAYDSLSSANFI